MILVDTSVWIDYLGSAQSRASDRLGELLDAGVPVGLTSLVYQELLQGTADETSFGTLESYLQTQTFYHPKDPLQSYAQAARLYARCRRQGVTLRSTVDCLIAQVAIEHELTLLHNDKDFLRLAGVVPELKLFEGF